MNIRNPLFFMLVMVCTNLTAQTQIHYMDGQYCLLNEQGEPISKHYDWIDTAYDHRFKCSKQGRYGYLDPTGSMIIPCVYRKAKRFIDGIAVVASSHGYWLINKQGKRLNRTPYQAAFVENRNCVRVKVRNKWGIINAKCEFLHTCSLDDIRPFACGVSIFTKDGKVGVINDQGKVTVPPIHDFIPDYKQNLSWRFEGDKAGIIDRWGHWIGEPIYESVSSFSENLSMAVLHGKTGFLDTLAQVVIPFEYEKGFLFRSTHSMVQKGGRWAIIDKEGLIKTPFVFDYGSPFIFGRALVPQDGKLGFIDEAGEWVLHPSFDDVSYFDGSLVLAAEKGKWGIASFDGEYVAPPSYKAVNTISEGMLCVRSENGYGFLSAEGQLVIPCQFDLSAHFQSGLCEITFQGKKMTIDQYGNMIQSEHLLR